MMRGLYAITSEPSVTSGKLVEAVEKALIGGAAIIQYRDKRPAGFSQEKNLEELLGLCRDYGSMLIVNDDVELARRVNADGVHLGQGDMQLEHAREHMGPGKMIGISCYGDTNRVAQALDDGADYIALGRFFASATKPGASGVSLEVLKSVRKLTTQPIVAIGGITAENGGPLVEAGADMLAAVEGVFGQQDITRAARDISALFLTEQNKDQL